METIYNRSTCSTTKYLASYVGLRTITSSIEQVRKVEPSYGINFKQLDLKKFFKIPLDLDGAKLLRQIDRQYT